MDTFFAPAERTERRKLKNQIDDISYSPIMNALLSTMRGLLVVINEDRQLVAINHAFLEAIGITNPAEVLGLRIGESLNCVHAHEPPNGCGTTPHCITCGAAIAMMAAINEDKIEERICALTSKQGDETQERALLVRAQPITIEGHRWILVFAQDITKQHFWANMERVFFHDINNTLNSLFGYSQLLALDLPDNENVIRINEAAERICKEISYQRSFSQHKDVRSLLMRERQTTMAQIKKEVALVVYGHKSAEHKQITESWPDESVVLCADPLLVSRVLGNMMINALEASPEGATVRLATKLEPSDVLWEIWNDCPIPDEVQKRIFQKYFSTKAEQGRGLGTYSMKLFGENLLHGKISFVSSKEAGTTFSFLLPRAPSLTEKCSIYS